MKQTFMGAKQRRKRKEKNQGTDPSRVETFTRLLRNGTNKAAVDRIKTRSECSTLRCRVDQGEPLQASQNGWALKESALFTLLWRNLENCEAKMTMRKLISNPLGQLS